MIRSLAAFSICVLFFAGCGHGVSHALTTVPQPRHDADANGIDVTVPQNWLAQKVCVDTTNAPVAVDPYSSSDPYGNGCSGYSERNLQDTDSVPYYRYATTGSSSSPQDFWYGYSFPVMSGSGEQMFVMDRDLTPSLHPAGWYVNPNYYPAHTHWDLYRIQNGWVSNASTRDASGFNQIFFGDNSGMATPYNGWIDFPVSFFGALTATPATANVPVHDVYWEQSALSWPLPPQTPPTSTSTQTTWKMITAYTFDSGKTMNTLVAYHQPKPTSAMEIWYFTIPYGPTRWEQWKPGSSGSSSGQRCNPVGAQRFPYSTSSYKYYRANCVDWTRTALATAGSTVPPMPIPETNLLRNMHFSNDPTGSSPPSGWNVGSGLTLSQRLSTTSADTNGHAGVRYVRVRCNSSCSSASTLSQDVPISASANYSFGFDARTESGTAQVQVSLQQVDALGNVLPLSGTSVTATIGSSNDGSCSSSVVLCDAYIGQRTTITLLPGAVALRETIQPLTSGVRYDVPDAYLGLL